jgi:5'-nucleotidase
VTGKTLKQLLEHGVARSGPGEDEEPGRFPQVSGVRFEYDVRKPAGNRIVSATVGGRPIVDSEKYTVATSDFLVSRGGDGYTMFKDGTRIGNVADAPKDSEVFEAAIRSAPDATISPVTDGRIKRID